MSNPVEVSVVIVCCLLAAKHNEHLTDLSFDIVEEWIGIYCARLNLQKPNIGKLQMLEVWLLRVRALHTI